MAEGWETVPVTGFALPTAIARSAAPAAAAVAVERLEEMYPGIGTRLEEDVSLRAALLAVVGASRSLTELLMAEPAGLQVLSALDRDVPDEQAAPSIEGLRRWKRLELLRIAARDLVGLDDLPVVGKSLSEMAETVLDRALTLAGAEDLAVIGMGKLGGSELNYASDVDVIFVASDAASGERAARAMIDIARSCFRVDVDLRPEGRDGPLIRSLASYEAYWDRWAHTWEFQALIKARPVAGDSALGSAFLAAARKRVWGRKFTQDDVRAVRAMKARSESELARRGLTDREVKRGRGGIRDIEFAVQLLQLVHGGDDPAVRSPTTLDALAELGAGGYIDVGHARALEHAYRLLRTVEHRLQLVQEEQIYALPTDAEALTRLARVMGYRDTANAPAAELLTGYLRQQQAAVRTIHEHLFFRPLLDALSAAGPTRLSSQAVAARLAAFGFTDAERTRQALEELTRGLSRSSRLMQQMLPLLLSWLSEAPDPDLGLLGLRLLSSGEHRANELAVTFRESPEAARRLCSLVGTSRRLTDSLERNPDLVSALGDLQSLSARTDEALLEGATAALSWRGGLEDRQRGLRRFQRREELRIAAADVLGLSVDSESESVVVTGGQLSGLADASAEAALRALDPPLPFVVIAMGRFGGAELSYASDLDLLFVYDGSTPEDFVVAEKVAEGLVQFLGGVTPASRVYRVDNGLRPEGKDGPLARSLGGYRKYYERWAQVWERQALIRARPVAGDLELGGRFLELVEPFVWGRPLPESEVREIRRMKARIERERIPAGQDPQFHLKLGRGSLSDVEFTTQLLQLRHGVRATGTMAALGRLGDAGAIDAHDREVLAEAYRFCEETRNRWFLVKGGPDDALPAQLEPLGHLARSLGTTPAELREDYRRVTRRSRDVVERLFYGKADG
ncbi:MAG TPA: bifunctional [glutamine synthetase] adenylyltransferase/[glutamine synthetase]-adenylyl-L-tyrosine phosphorylase [Acidimicrobiales bacterium]|nr:bifunctional [glutamine synthetase] adenylyltransferase/[glutamine synthetase]-adenylyl-L-tyrosine phosphorylase [Acidimicrobiales bacterium]